MQRTPLMYSSLSFNFNSIYEQYESKLVFTALKHDFDTVFAHMTLL